MLTFLSKQTQGNNGRTNVPETQQSLGLEMQVCKCTIGNFYPQLARHRGDRTGHRAHYSATVPQMGSIQNRCKSTRMWNFSTHCTATGLRKHFKMDMTTSAISRVHNLETVQVSTGACLQNAPSREQCYSQNTYQAARKTGYKVHQAETVQQMFLRHNLCHKVHNSVTWSHTHLHPFFFLSHTHTFIDLQLRSRNVDLVYFFLSSEKKKSPFVFFSFS